MFMDATAFEPGMKAILISPFFPELSTDKCLSFRFYVFGYDSGNLRILDETFETYSSLRESSYKIFLHCVVYLVHHIFTGKTFCDGLGSAYSDQNKWFDFYVDIPGVWRRFMVEGVRGGVSIEADDGVCVTFVILQVLCGPLCAI